MKPNKKEQNVFKLVRKSNELVEARYKLDIWETRIFTKMLTMITREDEDFQPYRIYLKEVIDYFGLDGNNDAYDRLRAGGMKLMSKIVKVVRNTDEGPMELNTPIIVGVDRPLGLKDKSADAKFIDVSFHPGMKPFLLSLQSHFTYYDARNITKLPSSYSIRIYELLKQYQKIGKRKFDLTELKEIVGAIEVIDVNGKKKFKDNYPKYGNFNQRVLKKAEADLKEFTDIRFTYEPIKRGRAVAGIIFHIKSNTPTQTLSIEEKNTKIKIEPADNRIFELHNLVKEWVGVSVVRGWMAKHTEEQIRNGIQYTINQLSRGRKITNVGGYLNRMVAEAELIDPVEIEKRTKKINFEKQQKVIEESKKVETLELEKARLQFAKEAEMIEQILNTKPETKSLVAQQAMISSTSNYNPELSWDENFTSPIFKAFVHNTVKRIFADQF